MGPDRRPGVPAAGDGDRRDSEPAPCRSGAVQALVGRRDRRRRGLGDDPERRERGFAARTRWPSTSPRSRRSCEHPERHLLSGLVEAEEEGSRLYGGGVARERDPPAHERPRDDDLRDRQRHARPAPAPRPACSLRDDPGLIGGAVEEILRYDGSVQMRGVSAADDFVWTRPQIRAGGTLWLAIGARPGSRQFAEPNRLDIARSPNRHLQFGLGPHFCIGRRSHTRRSSSRSQASSLAFARSSSQQTRSSGTRSPSSAVPRHFHSRSRIGNRCGRRTVISTKRFAQYSVRLFLWPEQVTPSV